MPEKSIPIVLNDGKTRHLRYEWEHICRLKREHAISVFDMGRDMMLGSADPLKITGIIWAGLLHEEPEITVEQVEKLMSFSDLAEYMKALFEAIPSSLSPEETEQIKKIMGSSQKESGISKE